MTQTRNQPTRTQSPRRLTTPASRARPARPATPRLAAAFASPLDAALNPGLFRSLADGTRLRLLGCLIKCGRPCSVSEVAECCAVDFSVVSRHLQQLERAGILESLKQGRTMSYSVRYAGVCGMLRALADAIDNHCPGPEACGSGAKCGC